MKKTGILAALAVLSLVGCAKDGVPLIGLDDKGQLIERYESDAKVRDELARAAGQVGQSAFSAINASPADQSGMLRTVAVGIGFNLSGGLGPIITMGVAPKARFIFSNSKTPIVP
jgi:hypothetical protein